MPGGAAPGARGQRPLPRRGAAPPRPARARLPRDAGDRLPAVQRHRARRAAGRATHGGLRPAPDGADGQADRALARFGLEDIAERHPLSLSGGQRQRLAIAVGILQGARVLVLDEPTSGLDFGTMGRVADEVRRARDAGACIVVVTHDYEFVCAACDQVAVLEDGVVSDVLPVRGEALGRIRRAIGIDGRARPL
ncbi:ATP-binding cassette domain-containing protein [Eggerthella lenta]|uniref:ATP-binding cassette domain-containing protein n=1 Tax=Eggerthella lenta TaxID=84112 RepID=UPI0031B5EAA0